MRSGKYLSLLLAVTLLALTSCAKRAQKNTQAMTPPTPQQMEEAFKQASTPGAEHKLLASLVGKWDATVSMWMDPTKPAEVTKGTSIDELKFGGRYLQMNYTGEWMGQKFDGQGLLGYDNVGKRYQSIWHDSMMTAISTSTGTYDPVTKKITFKSVEFCPIEKGPIDMKQVISFVDDNKHTYEAYRILPDGTEVKAMEIVYKRAGSCKTCGKSKSKKKGKH